MIQRFRKNSNVKKCKNTIYALNISSINKDLNVQGFLLSRLHTTFDLLAF